MVMVLASAGVKSRGGMAERQGYPSGDFMKPISMFIRANVVGPRGKVLEKDVRATVISRITSAALAEITSWKPILEMHRQEDEAWNWPAIVEECRAASRTGEASYEFIILRARRDVQSLMILETEAHLSLQTRTSILYVEYLAVAPWNRPPIQSPRRFSGCGSALIEFAIRRSEELGYDGRVGLHSLPGSRTFYARSGFIDLGADEAEGGLHYFEYRG